MIVLMGLFSISLAFIRLSTHSITSSPFIDYFALNIPSACLFLFGALLINFRERLASRLFSDSSLNSLVDGVHIVRLGFIFLGLFLATLAFSGMLVGIIGAYEYSTMESPLFGVETPGFWERIFPALVGEAFQLACGLFFILGSMSLSQRVWSLQPIEDDDDCESLFICPVCHEPFDPADYQPDVAEPRCSRCGTVLDMSGTAESEVKAG